MLAVLFEAAFMLIYTDVPNRRVRIGDAFRGGLIAALRPRKNQWSGGRLTLMMDVVAAIHAVAELGAALSQRVLRQ